MDRVRERHVKEMERYKEIADKTDSKYLRRDYMKKYHRMKLELEEYDSYHEQK